MEYPTTNRRMPTLLYEVAKNICPIPKATQRKRTEGNDGKRGETAARTEGNNGKRGATKENRGGQRKEMGNAREQRGTTEREGRAVRGGARSMHATNFYMRTTTQSRGSRVDQTGGVLRRRESSSERVTAPERMAASKVGWR